MVELNRVSVPFISGCYRFSFGRDAALTSAFRFSPLHLGARFLRPAATPRGLDRVFQSPSSRGHRFPLWIAYLLTLLFQSPSSRGIAFFGGSAINEDLEAAVSVPFISGHRFLHCLREFRELFRGFQPSPSSRGHRFLLQPQRHRESGLKFQSPSSRGIAFFNFMPQGPEKSNTFQSPSSRGIAFFRRPIRIGEPAKRRFKSLHLGASLFRSRPASPAHPSFQSPSSRGIAFFRRSVLYPAPRPRFQSPSSRGIAFFVTHPHDLVSMKSFSPLHLGARFRRLRLR